MKMKTKKSFGIAALLGLMVLSGTGCQAQQEQKHSGSTEAAQDHGQAQAPAQKAGISQTNVEGAAKLIMDHADLQILDVRTPEEISSGMIEGAKHINIFDADFDTRAAAELDKSKPVLVYCKVGGRSSRAAGNLEKMGFAIIYNLQGGMDAWKAAGKPVTK